MTAERPAPARQPRVSGLSLRRGKPLALNGVDLDIPPQE